MDTKGDKRGRWEELGDSDGHVHSPVYKVDKYCIAQGTLHRSLWSPEWEGSPKGRGHVYACS